MIFTRIFSKYSTPCIRQITQKYITTTAILNKNNNIIQNAINSEKILYPLVQQISFQKPILKRIEDAPTTLNRNKIIENPKSTLLNEINDILKNDRILEMPTSIKNQKSEIRAARLIVIRRRKMKKHKLRKLRKKMKFEWAKVRQRREMRKEKAFQAILIAQIKEAEKFSAEEYVNEKLRKANETPIPRYWKGRRLPQFLIKQYLGIK